MQMFTLLPRALKAAACFLAVCKIELVMVGESDLLLDLLHIFPQILAFLVCVCACACVFSAVSVISHHVHAVISIFTISSISALHPTQFHAGTPPRSPSQSFTFSSSGHRSQPPAFADLRPSLAEEKQSGGRGSSSMEENSTYRRQSATFFIDFLKKNI